MLRPSTAIAHAYAYTRDLLLHICEAIVRILHLNRLLPLGSDSSAKGRTQAKDADEDQTTWTMTVESYNPRDFSSQPEHELPVAAEVKDDSTGNVADAGEHKPTRVDKLGDVVVYEQHEQPEQPEHTEQPEQPENTEQSEHTEHTEQPEHTEHTEHTEQPEHTEHTETALMTPALHIRVLADNDANEETPEVHECNPDTSERADSNRDVLTGDKVSNLAVTESLSPGSEKQDLGQMSSVSNATEDECKLGAKAPDLELKKTISSDSGGVDLDRVSTLSNATDDTEDDRMRALDSSYAQDEQESGRNKSYSLEDKMLTRALARRERASSRGARSEAEIAQSKLDGWSSSSDEEDEAEYMLPRQSPRFMPTMTHASFLSL